MAILPQFGAVATATAPPPTPPLPSGSLQPSKTATAPQPLLPSLALLPTPAFPPPSLPVVHPIRAYSSPDTPASTDDRPPPPPPSHILQPLSTHRSRSAKLPATSSSHKECTHNIRGKHATTPPGPALSPPLLVFVVSPTDHWLSASAPRSTCPRRIHGRPLCPANSRRPQPQPAPRASSHTTPARTPASTYVRPSTLLRPPRSARATTRPVATSPRRHAPSIDLAKGQTLTTPLAHRATHVARAWAYEHGPACAAPSGSPAPFPTISDAKLSAPPYAWPDFSTSPRAPDDAMRTTPTLAVALHKMKNA
ncbi:hypothetical protein HETIRDRAFT_448228 [Heterobasidion irregulare TC 32-1]|uniref:Uncharacterized protein n=1 Tax=Heterobasidion irregulare (strain TC 32-1) TaxID=747525 RepID=W4KPR1_HETIT|nr:uncharacterized protein HETIRDRAFT_448228 [Heterobasidion irregulare TC 32-1]ETW87813.1 hypothetical protein HETIRDRAFT_448228 [Heterobasidion irregulare TC 32-1]